MCVNEVQVQCMKGNGNSVRGGWCKWLVKKCETTCREWSTFHVDGSVMRCCEHGKS